MSNIQICFERYKNFILEDGKLQGLKSTYAINGLPDAMLKDLAKKMEKRKRIADRKIIEEWFNCNNTATQDNGLKEFGSNADPGIVMHIIRDAVKSIPTSLSNIEVEQYRESDEFKPFRNYNQDNTELVVSRYLYIFRHEGDESSTDGSKDFIRIDREIYVGENELYHEIDIEQEYDGDVPDNRAFPNQGTEFIILDDEHTYYIWMSDHQLTVNRMEYLRRFMQNALESDYPPGKVNFKNIDFDIDSNDNSSTNLLRFGKEIQTNYFSIILHDYNLYREYLLKKAEEYENALSLILRTDFEGTEFPIELHSNEEKGKYTVSSMIYNLLLSKQPMESDGTFKSSNYRSVRRYIREIKNDSRERALEYFLKITMYQRCLQILAIHAKVLIGDPRFSETIVDSFFTLDKEQKIDREIKVKSDLALLLGMVGQTKDGMKKIKELLSDSKAQAYAYSHDNNLTLQSNRDFCYNYRETVDFYDRRRKNDRRETLKCPLPALHWMSELHLKNTCTETSEALEEANGALLSFLIFTDNIINSEIPSLERENEILKIITKKLPGLGIKIAEETGKASDENWLLRRNPSRRTLFKGTALYGGILKTAFDYYAAISKIEEDPKNIDGWLELAKVNLEIIGKITEQLDSPQAGPLGSSRNIQYTASQQASTQSIARNKLFIKSFLKYAPAGIDVVLELKATAKNISLGQEQLLLLNGISIALIIVGAAFSELWIPVLIVEVIIAVLKKIFADTYPEVCIQYTYLGRNNPGTWWDIDHKIVDNMLVWKWHGEGPEYKLISPQVNDTEWTTHRQAQMFGLLPYLMDMDAIFCARNYTGTSDIWGSTILKITLPALSRGIRMNLTISEEKGNFIKTYEQLLELDLIENENCRIVFHENKYLVFVFLHNSYDEDTYRDSMDLWKKTGFLNLFRDKWLKSWSDDMETRPNKVQRVYKRITHFKEQDTAYEWSMKDNFAMAKLANIQFQLTLSLPDQIPDFQMIGTSQAPDLKLRYEKTEMNIPVAGYTPPPPKKDTELLAEAFGLDENDEEPPEPHRLEDFDGLLNGSTILGLGDGIMGQLKDLEWDQ